MSATSSRDRDRAAVYAAEDAVFLETLFVEPLGPAGVIELAAALRADPWWQANGVAFEVAPTRREAHHSWAAVGPSRHEAAQIRLSIHQEDAATLAHEAAHLIASTNGADTSHGSIFRRAHLDVVAVVCGIRAADRLAAAFVEAGLPCAARSWDPPDALCEHGLYGKWRLARRLSQI